MAYDKVSIKELESLISLIREANAKGYSSNEVLQVLNKLKGGQ